MCHLSLFCWTLSTLGSGSSLAGSGGAASGTVALNKWGGYGGGGAIERMSERVEEQGLEHPAHFIETRPSWAEMRGQLVVEWVIMEWRRDRSRHVQRQVCGFFSDFFDEREVHFRRENWTIDCCLTEGSDMELRVKSFKNRSVQQLVSWWTTIQYTLLRSSKSKSLWVCVRHPSLVSDIYSLSNALVANERKSSLEGVMSWSLLEEWQVWQCSLLKLRSGASISGRNSPGMTFRSIASEITVFIQLQFQWMSTS